jgi:hypothetical protein
VSETSTHLRSDTGPFERAYRAGAGLTAAEGEGVAELPSTTGRRAHAEIPVNSESNASPSTTAFSRVFIFVLLLSINSGRS